MTEIRNAWRNIAVRLGASGAPTPLIDLPRLALRCGVAQVLVKDESQRPLGNFKVLGGVYAGLRALARHVGSERIDALFAPDNKTRLPILLCASDGNHGLAVATGARLAGTSARVYLHEHVPEARARRITEAGATISWIKGSYDDAVDEAAAAAARGEGLLIADTAADNDPVVADVMDGYHTMTEEVVAQIGEQGWSYPTHLFLQAGVGGMAAAMAEGLSGLGRPLSVIVEPETVDCVGEALRRGRIERLPGNLETAAEMLSCGEASAPALRILLRHGAEPLAVTEAGIRNAVEAMADNGGPATTPSGATGLAGLLAAAEDPTLKQRLHLDGKSRILLVATEGPLPS